MQKGKNEAYRCDFREQAACLQQQTRHRTRTYQLLLLGTKVTTAGFHNRMVLLRKQMIYFNELNSIIS